MIKRFEFTSQLGWSVSRYDLFKICKRQYYYVYYSKYDPVYPKIKIDKLKKMTSIPLETGNIVHDVLKTLLERLQRNENKIDTERFFDYARRKTVEYCKSKTFEEVYYCKIQKLTIDEIVEKVKICLENFLNSGRLDWLFHKAVKNKIEWVIEPPGFGETRIEGMKAYCKVDFLFPVEDNLFIIDWKTGKPDSYKHNKQLIGYTSWASFHLDKDPVNITPVIAYLSPFYDELQVSINEFDIQEFASRIRVETEEMYSYCVNVEENIPKDKEVFVKTQNRLCDYCNFKELC